jgi:hypothetical protein
MYVAAENQEKRIIQRAMKRQCARARTGGGDASDAGKGHEQGEPAVAENV